MAKKNKNYMLITSKWLAYSSLLITTTALYYKFKLQDRECSILDIECYKYNLKNAVNDTEVFNLYGWIPLTILLISIFIVLALKEWYINFSKTRARKKSRRAREE